MYSLFFSFSLTLSSHEGYANGFPKTRRDETRYMKRRWSYNPSGWTWKIIRHLCFRGRGRINRLCFNFHSRGPFVPRYGAPRLLFAPARLFLWKVAWIMADGGSSSFYVIGEIRYIYVHTVERTDERRIKWPATIGGCGSRIVTRRYAIFIVKRACERKGRNTRFSYVCITSDIRGGRLITCSRYSGLKGV